MCEPAAFLTLLSLMLSDSVAAGGDLHRINQSDLFTDEVRCEMTKWDPTFPTRTDTEKDIKPPTCQETPLMCSHASVTHRLQWQHLLCGVCHPCPHPVIPSVTLQPPPFMFCQGPVFHWAPTLPLAVCKIKLCKLSDQSGVKTVIHLLTVTLSLDD